MIVFLRVSANQFLIPKARSRLYYSLKCFFQPDSLNLSQSVYRVLLCMKQAAFYAPGSPRLIRSVLPTSGTLHATDLVLPHWPRIAECHT